MRKILSIILIILLSGCSCKYEITIKNGNVVEDLIVNGVTTEIPVQADLANFSTHSYSKNLEGDVLKYQTSYKLNNLKKSDFLTCFDSYNFFEDEDSYILKTGTKFKCFPYQYNDFDMLYYDKLDITLSTNHNVIEHNAVSVEKGVYHWYITSDNIDNAEIYFKISKNPKQPIIILALTIFMIIVGIIGFIVYLIAKHKSSNNNKI